MAIQETEGQQSNRASHCSRQTAGPESMTVAARLDAVELDCTLLLEAQTEAALQRKGDSEVGLQTTVDFEAEEASSPRYWYVVRLVGH